MARKILILGASYGSLLATKFLMAGHDVTLVCRSETADLINAKGTIVRIPLKGEEGHRAVRSKRLPGRLNAMAPEAVPPAGYDLCCLAMQEPQYGVHAIWSLMVRIAEARVPCLSIMNMPPLPYLKRLPGLDARKLEACYTQPRVWERFDPALVTLCSPDPQAFRPADEPVNVLHVGLPTNFKAAAFGDPRLDAMLAELAAEIESVRFDGKDVPVKLRLHQSPFVPLAKWAMLLTGNYRCVTGAAPISIRDAVHGDIARSRGIYDHVNAIVRSLGAGEADAVPFEKYAAAAEKLLKPSSAARALAAGSPMIERVDMLVQRIGRAIGMANTEIDRVVETVDAQLADNRRQSA